MTPQQLVGIGVRLFALWLGLTSLTYITSALSVPDQPDMAGAAALAGLMGAGCLLIGLVLWFAPMLVAHKLLPRTQHDNHLSCRAHELARVGCSLLGLWLFAKALPQLVWFLLRAFLVADSGPAFSALSQEAKLEVGVGLFEAVFAMILMLKSGAFARLAVPAEAPSGGARMRPGPDASPPTLPSLNTPMTQSPQSPETSEVRSFLLGLQQRIIDTVGAEDGKAFSRDPWSRPPESRLQGEGITCVLEGGALLERGGCAFSHVRGPQLPPSATQHRPELAGAPFEALGVSLVFHPRNPYVPTVHMNVRMLVATPPGGAPVRWFGGGMDLTPYYGFEEDARHFHRTCRDALAPFGDGLYPRFKTWCDEYFFLKHRQEPRGIGGVFFDDFSELGPQRSFEMMQAVGNALLVAWLPIAQRRRGLPYTERERDFQTYRRGRYVEFNLVWDRGTLFGLQSGGRTESILMSMPPAVTWRYGWTPEPGTPEAHLYSDFLRPRDWAAD